MKTVTVEMLRDLKACPSQVTIFESEWPEGAAPTPETTKRARKLGLDLFWLAGKVNGDAAAEARAVYLKAAAEARAVYLKAAAPAWAVYEKAADEARAVLNEAVDQILIDWAKG